MSSRKKKRKMKWHRLLILLLVILNLCLVTYLGYLYSEENGGTLPFLQAIQENREEEEKKEAVKQEELARTNRLKSMSLHSEYARLTDLHSQDVLYEKKSMNRIYPASLTKIMSAVIALESIKDMHAIEYIQGSDIYGLAAQNASVAGFFIGEQVTYEDLLYGLVLSSGADCANVLANRLYGSQEAFVTAMNKKAKELGMENTNFVNATGLHEDNHYTTLSDLEKMIAYAWKNPTFQTIFTTMEYRMAPTPQHPNGLILKSTLKNYNTSLNFTGGSIIGGKTGYTLEAQYCLASIAKMDDGSSYLFLSAKASEQPPKNNLHILDAITAFETIK